MIWLAADHEQLSDTARREIARQPGNLFVLAISAFEIAIKHRQGNIELPCAPMEWFTRVIEHHGIHELPISSSIAIQSVQLPTLHNDLCNRMIIATAEIRRPR